MKIIDLSINTDNECMTCGTPWHQKVAIEKMGTIDKVGRNTSSIVLGSHSGTHMDAPLHFYDGRRSIDELHLEQCIGRVTCVDFTDKPAGTVITKKDLEKIKVTERMLFVFGWYKNWKTSKYYDHFPYFEEDAVNDLIEKGMKLIALDTPSPDDGAAIYQQGKEDSPNHKLLLNKEIIIIEYLTNTNAIDFDKQYRMIALPLKLKGADGSPARVILEEI